MTSYLWILVLAGLAITKAQDFDLADAFDDVPTPKPADKKPPSGDDMFDLSDALGPDTPVKPKEPSKPAGNPSKTGGSDDFNIFDAVDPAPKKPSGGGGFSDSDLNELAGDDYKPDGGRGGRPGGRASDYDSSGTADQPQAAPDGKMAGIISAVGVAILGAASSYFAYQKKKLCFKVQGGADPESGRNPSGTRSEPQVLSNLLKIS